MNKDFLINILGRWKEEMERIDTKTKDVLHEKARASNGWFIRSSIDLAFKGLYNYLDTGKLHKWLNSYKISNVNLSNKKIGIVMAGNIPLVGFHDLLCVIVSGHKAQVKLSSQDDVLLPFLIDLLVKIEPRFSDRIEMVDRIKDPDAVIATGSDNSARYFHYYFKNISHIIRRNRTSIGILNGKEKSKSILDLGNDILTYFGLGCRNVSKVFVPERYNFRKFFDCMQPLESVSNNRKYINNYDYNKSIFLVNQEDFQDNGFLLLKESDQLVSPVSVVFFEYYSSLNDVEEYIGMNKQKIQCIVSDNAWFGDSINFGETQIPDLWDYPDDVDIIQFLQKV